MVYYDENVIIEFAHRLYRRAATVALIHALMGFLISAGVIEIAGNTYGMTSPGSVVVVVGLIGSLIGYLVGRERAFALRLQAQTALCQAQIERNTRGVMMPGVAPHTYQMPPSPPLQVPR